jgi:hypothetical protein
MAKLPPRPKRPPKQATARELRDAIAAKALELKYDMLDLMAHINVVMVGAERGGQLAQICASGQPGQRAQ